MITFKTRLFDELETLHTKMVTFTQIKDAALKLRGDISPVLGNDCSHLYGSRADWTYPTKHESRYLYRITRGWYLICYKPLPHCNWCMIPE